MSGEKVSQELFLSVKERLDYYHLPSVFPIETTNLLNKLLKLLDTAKHIHPQGLSQPVPSEGLSAALKHEIGRLVKENNKLHTDVMTASQEIQSLQHRLYKIDANKHSEGKEMEKISILKGHREQELVKQLREVRFKYNELMDFIHEDPQFEREYIKRFTKQRHEKIDNHEQAHNAASSNHSPPKDKTHSSSHIKELEAKIKNREAEILRLQNIVEYDGINMNKLIKNFQESLVNNRLKVADTKINFLEESLDKVQQENKNMKNNNGSKEALRVEVEKCHQLINTLKKEVKELKRTNHDQSFDQKKQVSQHEHKTAKANSEKTQAEKQAKAREQYGQELQKKISFLQKETQQLRESLETANKSLAQKETANQQYSKKNEELRVFYEYEIETYKKKLQQLEFELHELKVGGKKVLHQNDILRREGEIKSESIINLQKIVNELLKKNSLLSDNPVGNLEVLKRNDDVQSKRQLIDLQQKLLYANNEREQLQADRKAAQYRLGVALKENQRLKSDLSYLSDDIAGKEATLVHLTNQLEDTKFLLKKTQNELNRTDSQLSEINLQKSVIQEGLKKENEGLAQRERILRAQLKEAELRLSEEQGTLDITKIKLEEREERIKHIEKLLGNTLDQSKQLSSRVADLEQQTHDLTREKQRLAKKYEEIRKEAEDFKNTSFRNYETAINDDLNERNRLKQEILRLADAQDRLQIRYQEVSGLLGLVRREKELQEVEKADLHRQNEHLLLRLAEMQEVERALVIENEALRNPTRWQ